jgi:uncharacterized protein (DUF2141 family)
MRPSRRAAAAPALFSALLAAAHPVAAADLLVRIDGVRPDPGEILVCLWAPTARGFPACGDGGAAARAVLPAAPGSVEVRFAGVAPGDYAVSVLHDADGDRRLATGFFGQPREGVGFSFDGRPVPRRAPVFDDARFAVAGDARVEVRMIYP